MTHPQRDLTAKELAARFDIEKLTPEFYADPYPTYRALRQFAPAKRLPSGGYFLTRYDDLVAADKTACGRARFRGFTRVPCRLWT